MKKRLLSTAAIVPLLSAAIVYAPSVVIVIILLVVSTLGILEFYRLLDQARIPAFRIVGATCGIALILATYFGFTWSANCNGPGNTALAAECEGCALALIVMILMVREFPQVNNVLPLPTIACTLLGVLYVPMLINFFTKIGLAWDAVGWREPLKGHTGCYMIFYVCLVAKFTDAGALFVGKFLGRHKMFPRLSPLKTWEGLAGGMAAGTLTSVLFVRLAGGFGKIQIGPGHAIILGLLLALAANIGDLAESLLKRAGSVKDSGQLVPGIGGVLDLIDSLVFAAPVFYVYARFVL